LSGRFFSSTKTITVKPVNIESQTEEKKPRKYCMIDRALQARILDESASQSQRQVAKKYNIPNTTLQHWIERKKELKGKTDPVVVDFFESSPGQAWLHNMVLATFMIFHQNGNSGIPDLSEYFDMTDVNKFVGTSISALQKVGKTIDKQIIVFTQEESTRLARNMPHKNIPGALDENFIMDEMTLILMEPVSGFILAEQIEEKRDAETWFKVTQAALSGLNVTIQQLVGDEAGGLTKLATGALKVIKGPDLFHIQQEITKGLTSHLARTLQQVKKKQEDLQREKLEMLTKLGEHLKCVEEIQELPKRGINAGKRIIEIEKEKKANQKTIEITENRYKTAQEARRGITHDYHPFSLDTGAKQIPEAVKAKLEKSYEILEVIAKEADCTDKQKQKLEKSKGALQSMIAILVFFFSFLALTIKSMGLDDSSGKLFERIVSIEYLKLCLQRAKKKKQKDKIKATISRLEDELGNDSMWRPISHTEQTAWRRKALECAHVFQRSSSCVEGRNGQLSLKFHAFRRLNRQTLQVLTVLHNFFIRRVDGTTAAERFFEQKPRDLFMWLLDKVELPRPREKHKRLAKKVQEQLVA
jgi:hypothetical protein